MRVLSSMTFRAIAASAGAAALVLTLASVTHVGAASKAAHASAVKVAANSIMQCRMYCNG